MNNPIFPEHFSREDGASGRARTLSKWLQSPVYAILRPDADGRWHVGTTKTLDLYPDRQRYVCIEIW